MTKSKKHGKDKRRQGALERLKYNLEITDKVLGGFTLAGAKKQESERKQKRIKKEIENLQNKL